MNDKHEADPFLDYSLIKKLVVAIGEVSEITEVPTRKIRYWEEKGAITSVEDTEGVTRRFDYWNIKKIIFIRELIEEGFTLDAAVKKAEIRMENMNQAFFKLADSASNNNEPK